MVCKQEAGKISWVERERKSETREEERHEATGRREDERKREEEKEKAIVVRPCVDTRDEGGERRGDRLKSSMHHVLLFTTSKYNTRSFE